MPYITDGDKEKIDVTIECDINSCIENNNGRCHCDCDKTDLIPNSTNCTMYVLSILPGESHTFGDIDSLHYYVESCPEIQFVSIDETCLRVSFIQLKYNRKERQAFVQISEEDEKIFNFKPSTDGGLLLIPKAQTDLFEGV